MNWYHETSADWLQARKNWLTASEVAKIIPVTATGRPRKESTCKNNMLEVWAGKQAKTVDVSSNGAAARGHVMEPFAINDFNDWMSASIAIAHHWDDALITNPDLGIAFSPDGLDVPQSDYDGDIEIPVWDIHPNVMYEVKSYSIDRHYAKGLGRKQYLEERWQIAHAMAVCTDIQLAYLIFYNPNTEDTMFVHRYMRADLEGEIQVILKAAKGYMKFKEEISKDIAASHIVGECHTCQTKEQDVIDWYKMYGGEHE